MILTPEQIDWYCGLLEKNDSETILAKGEPRTIAATLRAYAEIVEQVAGASNPDPSNYLERIPGAMWQLTDNEWGNCVFCGADYPERDGHEKDCIFIAAVRLRGKGDVVVAPDSASTASK